MTCVALPQEKILVSRKSFFPIHCLLKSFGHTPNSEGIKNGEPSQQKSVVSKCQRKMYQKADVVYRAQYKGKLSEFGDRRVPYYCQKICGLS